MDLFWKAVGGTLVAVILALTLEKQGKDFSILLTLAVSGMLAVAAMHYWEPFWDFLCDLEELADLNSSMMLTLMKILGISLTGEMSAAICTDAGNTSLGKGIHLFASAAIFSLSIPILSSLVDLLQQLLRGL